MDTWCAKDYHPFLDLRTRPARDLLTAIPENFSPKTIYDLGCGPGNSTILLKKRWPEATVIGLDASPDMLKAAKERYPELTFVQGHIEQFAPNEKFDFLFANASLQWVDHHEKLLPRLVECLAPNGIFALQMPNNFHSPTHQVIVQILQRNPAWQHYLNELRYSVLTEPLYNLSSYYELLINMTLTSIQLWETEYLQEMQHHQAIFDWLKGTGLRPVLTQMDETTQMQFRQAYIRKVATAYPLQSNQRILLPYRRLFITGVKQ